LCVAGTLVRGVAADVVAVLSQIGQVAEISEGPDDADGLVTRQGLEHFFKGFVGTLVGITPESDRQKPGLLDQLVSGHTILFANHIAQQAAQQTDVIQQRALVLLGVLAR